MRWTELSVIAKLRMLKILIDLGNDRITKKTYKDFHTCKRSWIIDIKLIAE